MINVNKLDIKKLVEFINTDLKKNKDLSVNKWCDKVGIKRGTFKSKMKRENYIYNINERQYIYKDITSNITQENKENKPDVVKVEEIKATSNYNDITSNITKENNSNIDMDKLNILLNNLDELIKLIPSNITRNNTSNITINSNKNNVHSLRINDEIYDHIKARAKKENISISSIINKALLDYLNNYI